MSKQTSITLDEGATGAIERIVAGGRFASAGDVVRAGLRLLEDEEAKVAAFRAAIIEGEESGIAEDFDVAEFLAERRSKRTE